MPTGPEAPNTSMAVTMPSVKGDEISKIQVGLTRNPNHWPMPMAMIGANCIAATIPSAPSIALGARLVKIDASTVVAHVSRMEEMMIE